jgi:hypothetical protein
MGMGVLAHHGCDGRTMVSQAEQLLLSGWSRAEVSPTMKRPQGVNLSPADGEALIERLERDALSADDRRLLVQVVRWLFWLLCVVQEAKLSLKRLRTLVFGKPSTPPTAGVSESAAVVGEAECGRGGEPGEAPAAASTEAPRSEAPRQQDDEGEVRRRGGHRAGQGRHGAAAYVGAARVACRHEALRVGQGCPGCGQGRLYTAPPGVEIRLDGNALLSATRYELEKLRCSACGEIFTAGLPAEASEAKYSAQARAVLAVSRYYLGLPGYRLQAYQAMLGVPVPDATQWD